MPDSTSSSAPQSAYYPSDIHYYRPQASPVMLFDPRLASDANPPSISTPVFHSPSHPQFLPSVAAGRNSVTNHSREGCFSDITRSIHTSLNSIPHSCSGSAKNTNQQPSAQQSKPAHVECPHNIFQQMLVRCLRSGGKVGGIVAAREAGFPHKSHHVKKQLTQLRLIQCNTEQATLEAQLQAVEALQPGQMGNPDFSSRALFDGTTLKTFEATLKLYADLGWPLDIEACQEMMLKHLMQKGTPDWMTDEPHVSLSYVHAFLRGCPDLKRFKASNIDPIRAKKATPEV